MSWCWTPPRGCLTRDQAGPLGPGLIGESVGLLVTSWVLPCSFVRSHTWPLWLLPLRPQFESREACFRPARAGTGVRASGQTDVGLTAQEALPEAPSCLRERTSTGRPGRSSSCVGSAALPAPRCLRSILPAALLLLVQNWSRVSNWSSRPGPCAPCCCLGPGTTWVDTRSPEAAWLQPGSC